MLKGLERLKHFFSFSFTTMFLLIALSACGGGSSDNDGLRPVLGEQGQGENLKLLTAKVYVEKPDAAPDYSEYMDYENGYLVGSSGYTPFDHSYTYDEEGKLISSVSVSGQLFSYFYDDQGRLIQSFNEDNNEEVNLTFGESKIDVEWKRASALAGASPDDFYYDYREVLLDDFGRIKIINNTTPDDTTFSKRQEAFYDEKGNITRYEYIDRFGEAKVLNFSYYDIQNPYYSSLKKLYNSAYYLMNFFNLSPSLNERALSPNLIDTSDPDDTYYYEVSGDGYPERLISDRYLIEFIYE